MFRRVVALAAAGLLMISTPAWAQSPPPELPFNDQGFEHAHSKLRVPATLLGYKLTKVVEYAPDRLDVAATWDSADNKEVITVYIYRFVSGGVPVWFDRARHFLENRREIYGDVTLLPGMLAFTPPGQSTASGLTAIYATQGEYRSTSVALLPMGGWLVKVRYSSATLTAEQLAPRVQAVLAALGWPKEIAAAPAAVPVEPCATPLKFDGEAKPAKQDVGTASMTALLSAAEGAADDSRKRPASPVIRWCRDPALVQTGAVYRADESPDSYLLALSDAGRAIRVGPDTAAAVLAKAAVARDGKTDLKPAWTIALINIARHVNFAAVDRLPSPGQALAIVKAGRFASIAPTWGKERQVQINPEALK